MGSSAADILSLDLLWHIDGDDARGWAKPQLLLVEIWEAGAVAALILLDGMIWSKYTRQMFRKRLQSWHSAAVSNGLWLELCWHIFVLRFRACLAPGRCTTELGRRESVTGVDRHGVEPLEIWLQTDEVVSLR